LAPSAIISLSCCSVSMHALEPLRRDLAQHRLGTISDTRAALTLRPAKRYAQSAALAASSADP
jgi:hypothetical protein